ncbi:MAG: cation transporter [Sphingobacteriia bacterium]|nr:cation transporter [Sphingobacteriia bacterium]
MKTNNKPKILTFKTNINCSGCVAKVSPALNSEPGISSWNVNSSVADKILTVVSDGATEAAIIKSVKASGFNIEPIQA